MCCADLLCRALFNTTALVGVWLGCELLPHHIYCLTSVAVSLEQLGREREEQFSECLVLRGRSATIQHKHSIYLKCRPTAASRLALMPLERLIQISNLVSGCVPETSLCGGNLLFVEIMFVNARRYLALSASCICIPAQCTACIIHALPEDGL